MPFSSRLRSFLRFIYKRNAFDSEDPEEIEIVRVDEDHVRIIVKQDGEKKETLAVVFSQNEMDKIDRARKDLEEANNRGQLVP
jgi:hypothetical protein